MRSTYNNIMLCKNIAFRIKFEVQNINVQSSAINLWNLIYTEFLLIGLYIAALMENLNINILKYFYVQA